jgi:Uma2 family endonuclease
MGTVAQKLITFEEFLALPEPEFGHYEFREGEVILVPPPKPLHLETIDRIVTALRRIAPPEYRVLFEFAYQIDRSRFIVSDVAVTADDRWRATVQSRAYFDGAPELAIEVLSPSNTAAEIADKRTASLLNGCVEFWTVDPERRTIEVFHANRWRTVRSGEYFAVELFGGTPVAADDIFPAPVND